MRSPAGPPARGDGTRSASTACAPGQVLTPGATNPATGEHWFKGGFDVHQILEEPGLPEDVANVVLFLASDEAKFLTGEIINVDGGCAVKL